jgi:hypothetical protein
LQLFSAATPNPGPSPPPSPFLPSHLGKKFEYRLAGAVAVGRIHLFNFDGLVVQPSEIKKWMTLFYFAAYN